MDARFFVILLFWSSFDKGLDWVFQLLKHFADLRLVAYNCTIRADGSYAD